ncbi:hypothetical protein D0867_06740 [Hortaea werneckii]|uniref:Uncharacterized protein n=1 Tax=Hortaea werneckii TaxID=91943 RepID=A0A3M7AQA1_HORWE|nr:hypothetical protein D0867_06740 [Hortaea werneckii]RMY29410.1 hypothetical protein D0866_08717 [Hortaea werneckii]
MPRKSVSEERSEGLLFVNYSQGLQGSEEIRKLVRSRATKHSHQDGLRKPKSSKQKQITPTSQSAQGSQSSSVADTSIPDDSTGKESVLFNETELSALSALAEKCRPRLLLLDGGRSDPFNVFPVSAEPWHLWVFEWYRTVHLPPGIAIVQKSQKEGEEYIAWHLRESIAEPAAFYMQLLNACTALVATDHLPAQLILALRSHVVGALNSAISDPRRQLSIGTLLTVGSIALHERLFGDAAVAVFVHGDAFRRMLALRGGIESLNMPRIGVKLLQFTDKVLSESNLDKTAAELLSTWAPQERRKRYYVPAHDGVNEVRMSFYHSVSEEKTPPESFPT